MTPVRRCACRRYELVQAADAQRFGVGASGEADMQQRERAAALQAALTQPPGRPVSLQREVTPVQAEHGSSWLPFPMLPAYGASSL